MSFTRGSVYSSSERLDTSSMFLSAFEMKRFERKFLNGVILKACRVIQMFKIPRRALIIVCWLIKISSLCGCCVQQLFYSKYENARRDRHNKERETYMKFSWREIEILES